MANPNPLRWQNFDVPPTLDQNRLREAGVEPPKTRPVPPNQALAYEASPEGQASKQQFNQARAQQAGIGSQYRGAGPAGNGASAGAAAEAEAAARYQQQMGRPGPGPQAAPTATPPAAAPGAPKPGVGARAMGAVRAVPSAAADWAKGGLKWAGSAGNAVGVTVGAAQSLRDMSTGYRDEFAKSVGTEDAGMGVTALTDTARLASNIGNALTGGYAEQLGRGISNYVSGGSFSEGFREPTHRDAYEAARGQPQGAAQTPDAKNAAQPAAAPSDRNPPTEANQAKLEAFALAEKQRAESEQLRQMGESFEARPGAGMARPDLGYGPIGDRTQLTNEQAAVMNPQGRITAVRQPNGTMSLSGTDVRGQVSYIDASGKALPGGGLRGQFSNFDVAPAGSNVVMSDGGYAFSTSGNNSGTTPQGNALRAENAQRAQALGADTAGLNPRQAQQYMNEVAGAQAANAAGAAQAAAYDRSGLWMNDLRDPRTMALRNASVGPTIFRNRREQDIATKKQQKKYDDTWNLVAGAPDREATRELEYTKSANTLRGHQMNAEAQMYSSDNTLRGNMYQSDLTAATAAQKAEADRKAAAYTQAKDYTAAQRDARKEAVSMFRREGDKDEGAAEQRVNVADQILPGFSTMDTASKARARPTVDSAVDLFDRMKAQTPQGMWEKLTSSDKPGLTGLPLIKGWKVERSFGGDHYITNPKTKQTITIGSDLNEMQLKMLENATQTGSFLPPKNK